jgi:hypothetical protein
MPFAGGNVCAPAVTITMIETQPLRLSVELILPRDEARRIAGEHRQAAGAFAKGIANPTHIRACESLSGKPSGTAVENLLFEAKLP